MQSKDVFFFFLDLYKCWLHTRDYNHIMHYKKEKEDSNAKITLPQSEHIDSFVEINTLHYTALQTQCGEKPVTLKLPYSALSMCLFHLLAIT